MDAPIACTLSPADAAERADHLRALAARTLRSRTRIPAGDRLVFAPGADTERALRAAVAAEAACCAFLRLELRREDDALVLDVTGPEAARPVIDALFA